MGVHDIRYTKEEKAVFLAKLLEELNNGETRSRKLAEKIGVSSSIIRLFQQQLIDER